MSDKLNTKKNTEEWPIIRGKDYRTVYSDTVRLGLSPWDFRLTFGVIVEPARQVPCTEDIITILMSPQHTKALTNILNEHLAKWEAVHGEIKLVEKDNDESPAGNSEEEITKTSDDSH